MFEKAAAGVTMRDGRVGVYGASKTPSPSTRTVTGSFRGVQGALFKGQPWRGLSADNGQRPSPSGERKAPFDGRRLSKVPLRYFRESNKGFLLRSPRPTPSKKGD